MATMGNGASSQKRSWWPTLAGLLLLLLGLVLLAFIAVSLARDLSIWVLGRTTTGRVVDQWVEQLGDQREGELSFRYYIKYEFETNGGQTITKTGNVSMDEWSGLGPGDPVRVLYFPPVPTHARLEERRYIPLFLCAYLPFVILAWAALRGGWSLLYVPKAPPKDGLSPAG